MPLRARERRRLPDAETGGSRAERPGRRGLSPESSERPDRGVAGGCGPGAFLPITVRPRIARAGEATPAIWKRIAVYAALAASAGAVFWLQFRAPAPAGRPEARPASVPRRESAAPAGDPYRLRPDVRVLHAVGDLHHLITGEPHEDARADFERGRWHVAHRSVAVGTLPEFPEFGDLERLLMDWALSLGLRDSLEAAGKHPHPAREARRAAIAAKLARLEATAAADLADRRWSAGDRDPELLRLAAHALVLLGVQAVDEVGGADRVVARALALEAACAALDPSAVASDAALLADVMGYAASAWERTESLPAENPVRLFVRHEDLALAKQAGRPAGTKEARFLALLRLARKHDLEPWEGWLERHFADDRALALALTCTSLEIRRFEMHLPAAIQVLAGVIQDLKMIGEVEDDEDLPGEFASLEAMIREFERLMSAMRPNADGVFLDAGVLRAYYRTCFYSALTILGEHLRESLSSLPDTRAFAGDLGEGDEGVAGEFQRWYTHLANAKLGKPELAALRKDLLDMPHFGAPLLLLTFDVIQDHSPYGDPGLRTAARRIARSLDTRPRNLVAFAAIVQRCVLDLERAENLYARGIRARGHQERRLGAWWARYRQDADSLQRMLRSRGLEPAEQADILEHLAGIPGVDSNAVEAGWERCLKSNRSSWELVDGYSKFARARREYPKARAALERWLALEGPSTSPFEEIFARTRLARNYADQGQYDEAIEVIEPMVESQQFGAMDCMVSLLEETHQLARAETLAVFAWGRYPDAADAQARVIELCWRQRKYALAARMLSRAPVPLTSSGFRSALAPHFVACFREAPAAGIRAVEAILASGYAQPRNLTQLAAALDQAGYHRMAYEVESRVPADGQEAVAKLGLCYHFMKRWKGEDAALEWLRPRVQPLAPKERALLTYVAYDSHDYELLWEVEAGGPDRDQADLQWLMRAAASARMGAQRDPHRADLERHYARRSRAHYVVLGRFLLGLEDAGAALATATDAKSTCETFYYLGLRAQSEGLIREAARCYAQCIETGKSYNGEYRWAFNQLYEWMSSSTSLARLEARAKRARTRPIAAADG